MSQVIEATRPVSTPTTTPVVPAAATTPGAAARPAAAHTDPRQQPALRPPVDVVEDANGITLWADLPGVSREQLELQVEGDELRIEAELTLDVPAGMRSGHAEVQRGRYRRSFSLSKELDGSQVSAELAHGVLKVRIPKAAHAQPRRIEVRLG